MTISFGNQSPFSYLHDSPAVVLASKTVSEKTRVVAIIRALCPPSEALRVMNTLPWQRQMNQGEGQNPPIDFVVVGVPYSWIIINHPST